MAANLKNFRKTDFNILVSFRLLVVIFLDIYNVDVRSNYDKLGVKTVSGLKSLNVNLINNFASRKNKLRSSSTIFQVEPKYLHKPSALTLLLILSGDVECNPGPRNPSVFHVAIMNAQSIGLTHLGVCCDECIWHPKSCEDISTK